MWDLQLQRSCDQRLLGKCQFCDHYGHKSHLCRNKKTNEEIEIAKRAKEDKKKDKKKKKKGKKQRKPWNW